jgi:hypothetical protein
MHQLEVIFLSKSSTDTIAVDEKQPVRDSDGKLIFRGGLCLDRKFESTRC